MNSHTELLNSDTFTELSLSIEPTDSVPRTFSSTSFLSKKPPVATAAVFERQDSRGGTPSLDTGSREDRGGRRLSNNSNGDILSDLQQDLHQLLTFACALVEENNNLKQILKGAIITFDDENKQELYESVMQTVHHVPSLKSLDRAETLAVVPEEEETITSNQEYSVNELTNLKPPLLSNQQDSSHDASAITQPLSSLDSSHDASAITQPLSSLDSTDTQTSSSDTITFDVAMTTETQTNVADVITLSNESSSNLDPGFNKRHTAADSIKKLYDLTITDSWKQRNKEEENTVISSPGRRALLTKTFRKNSEDLLSHQLPRLQGERPRSMTLNLDEPQVYVRELIPILEERNALKQRVFQLEEELAKQRKLFSSLAGRWGRSSSNASTLRRSRVLSVFEITEEEDSGNVPEVDRTPGTTLTRRTRLKERLQQEHFVTDVKVTGYTKHQGNIAYVIEISYSDNVHYELYRRYAEFFTFQNTLLHLFPAEAGKYNSSERVIPLLPAIDSFLSLFGRTNSESVIKSRLETINMYCKVLLLQLDPYISRDPFVADFFRPTIGDKQLPKLKGSHVTNSMESSGVSVLSVYPQHIPAGSVFEEYSVVADFNASKEGELTVMAGDVVKVISREPTGWWLVSKSKHGPEEQGDTSASQSEQDNEPEKIGYVPGDFLRRCEQIHFETSEEIRNTYLGFVSPAAAAALEEIDPSLRYVAIEDHQTTDGRQLNFMEGDHLVVVDKSEDGWWLATIDGKQGWVPASFLEPYDRRPHSDETVELEHTEVEAEKYVTMAPFRAENKTDISLPQSATVEVIEKSISGWWMVRYNGEIGLAPASLLALTDSELEVPNEQKFALTVDLGHGISGIIDPPPRSKRFLHFSQRRRANTDEKRWNKILEEAQLPDDSLESAADCAGYDKESSAHRSTVADKVRQKVTGRKNRFKTFVRTYSRSKRRDGESRKSADTDMTQRECQTEICVPVSPSSAPSGPSVWEGETRTLKQI